MSELTRQALESLRRVKLEPLRRETLEMTALVMGEQSAAALALKDAAAHLGEVRFWKNKNTILVEKLPGKAPEIS